MKTTTPPLATTQSSTAHSHPADSATTALVGKQTVTKSAPATVAGTATPSKDVTRTVKLADIRLDGGTQTRAEITDNNVLEYMQAMSDGADFPTIVLYDDGETLWLADGFHPCLSGLLTSPCLAAPSHGGSCSVIS